MVSCSGDRRSNHESGLSKERAAGKLRAPVDLRARRAEPASARCNVVRDFGHYDRDEIEPAEAYESGRAPTRDNHCLRRRLSRRIDDRSTPAGGIARRQSDAQNCGRTHRNQERDEERSALFRKPLRAMIFSSGAVSAPLSGPETLLSDKQMVVLPCCAQDASCLLLAIASVRA